MTSVLFVTQFIPSAIGHGGNHRAYQIQHDLCATVGAGNVYTVSLPLWQQQHFSAGPDLSWLTRLVPALRRRVGYYIENPARLFNKTGYWPGSFVTQSFIRRYEALVQKVARPALAMIEHSGFASLIEVNATHGIPTLACIQNLESLDLERGDLDRHWQMAARMLDFANEFRSLARCTERLFISTVEAGLVGGLGLSSHYYPYLPVGAIRQGLERIQLRRLENRPEPGLFLMVGSAGHQSTREAFEWFVLQAQAHGLPRGVRVVVGGSETDQLLPRGITVPGVELRGRLEQEEVDQLMVSAQAMLIPQSRGFGALTRLPETSCAGLRALVSGHPTFAMNVPPGVTVVDGSWEAWCRQMSEFCQGSPSNLVPHDGYLAWDRRQPRTLAAVLAGAVGSGS